MHTLVVSVFILAQCCRTQTHTLPRGKLWGNRREETTCLHQARAVWCHGNRCRLTPPSSISLRGETRGGRQKVTEGWKWQRVRGGREQEWFRRGPRWSEGVCEQTVLEMLFLSLHISDKILTYTHTRPSFWFDVKEADAITNTHLKPCIPNSVTLSSE